MQKTQDQVTQQEAERQLKLLLFRTEKPESAADGAYWGDLLLRTNRRIDSVSSGRSISISWAARVALPGAVAILFFFIGLHYYAPEKKPVSITVSDLLAGMPGTAQDTLVSYIFEQLESVDSTGMRPADLNPTEQEMAEYLVATDNTSILLRLLTDTEVAELMNMLRKNIQTPPL